MSINQVVAYALIGVAAVGVYAGVAGAIHAALCLLDPPKTAEDRWTAAVIAVVWPLSILGAFLALPGYAAWRIGRAVSTRLRRRRQAHLPRARVHRGGDL